MPLLNATASVRLEAVESWTAWGDQTATLKALLSGKIALQPTPVLGRGQGDPVPLALIGDWTETAPPRWLEPLRAMLARVPARPWGQPRFPVFVSSSNFGVGSLLEFTRDQDPAHLHYGTPHVCVDALVDCCGWGPCVTTVSHACVSAQVALELGRRAVLLGQAEQALVVSFDFLSPFVAGGFHSLKILNDVFPAPYADRSTGSIGLGDGAGWAVLSAAPGGWRLSPQALFNEMWHFTANEPEGTGFAALWAKLEPIVGGRRVWLKGHGTGTLEAARLESQGLANWRPGAPLISWKGSLGHTLGSCGVVELAIALAGMERGRIPGTVGTTGPLLGPNVATDVFGAAEFDGFVLLANAFGGAHAGCLIYHE